MEQRKNDWVATLFFNQDKTLQELVDLGFTVDNSDIKDRSYYESRPEIQQAFMKENGEFDNVKFNNFYNSAVSLYNNEDVSKMQADILNRVEYDPDDLMAPIGSKTWNKSTSIVHYANPNRQSRGIKNLNQLGDPTMSEREVGQMNKIFNPETGEFENETPNDLNLWEAFTGKPLALATWDENGYHDLNGQQIFHQKGDLKYNDEGDPYYEYLNGRSPVGKDLLHASDIFTVDGSNWNKYDFFDSDGLDKSAVGTIFKTITAIAPSFIPYVGGAYAALGASVELGKLLPELYKSIDGILTNDSSDNKTLNNVSAWLSRFDSSVSDKARVKMWNFENISNMVSDSSLQLIQQRMISKIPALINSGKYSENAIKWGRALSLSYMAGTSTTDTFNAFKEAGTSDRVAGLGAIASMFAMKKLMDNDYFRDFWYKGTPLARTEFKNAIKSAAEEVQKSIDVGTITNNNAAKKNFFDKTIDSIVKAFEYVTSKAILSSALNEGIEETGEEIVFDTIKGISNALNELGIFDKDSEYNFGFSIDSMLSRYATSFVGGAIGGATFHLHDKFQNALNGVTEDIAERKGFQELIYLIRNNRTSELKNELARWHQKGKLGSVNLSGLSGTFEETEQGLGIKYDVAKSGESQNDIIYKQISQIIDRVEGILDEENLRMTDDDLKNIRENNENVKDLDDESLKYLWKQAALDNIETKLGEDNGLVSGIFQDWNTLSTNVVSTKIQLEELLKPNEESSKTPNDIDAHIAAVKKSAKYKYLSENLKLLRERRDSLIKGEMDNYYTGQLHFAFQPDLAEQFGAIVGKNQFSVNLTGKKYDDLLPEDKAKVDELYKEYQSDEKKNVFKAYDVFFNLVNTYIDRINSTANDVEKYSELFNDTSTLYTDQINKLIQDKVEYLGLKNLELNSEAPDISKVAEYDEKLLKIDEEYKKLNQEAAIQTTRSLSEKGESIVKRFMQENRSFDIMAKAYLDWLNYLNSNGGYIEPEDPDFKVLLEFISKSISENYDRIKNTLRKNIIPSVIPTADYYNIIDKSVENAINLLSRGEIEKGLIPLNESIRLLNEAKDARFIDLEGDEVDQFIKQVTDAINTSHGVYFTDFLSQVLALKGKMKHSPVYNLLGEILAEIDPKLANIMNLILSDLMKLSNIENTEDYISRIPNALENLKSIKKVIPIVYSIMHHSSIIPSDTELSDSAEVVIAKEIGAIGTKVNRLISIIEESGKKKLVEQEKIMLNMRSKFANVLIGDPIITDKLSSLYDFDLKEEAKKLGITSNITLDNYHEYEKAVIKLETKFYQKVKLSGKNVEAVVDDLFGLFKPEIVKSRIPTQMGSDPGIIIEDYDKLIYLLSLVAYPSANFYNSYSSILNGNDLMPLYSQEYVAKIVYSFVQDPVLLNTVLQKFASITNVDENKYIASKSYLPNVLPLISGGAGTGKTFGVDGILYRLLKNDSNVITVAPEKAQAENLNNNIGHTRKPLTLDELIKKICGRSLDPAKDYIYKDRKFTIDPKISVSKDNIFGDKDKKILFFDEYSLVDSPKLDLISKWAKANGVLLIFSGDYMQNKSQFKYEGLYKVTGIEDWNTIYTPELITSIRAENAAQDHNYRQLRNILNIGWNKFFKDPTLGRGAISQKIIEAISKHGIELQYFETDGKFDGGGKVVSRNDIKQYIDLISKKTDNWVVIYDSKTESKYKDIDSNHKILRSQVQGGQYDYVIIDYDWDRNNDNKGYTLFDTLEDVYTMTQRSRIGVVMVKDGLEQLKIKNTNDDSSRIKLEMDKNQRSRFKEKRVKTFSEPFEEVEIVNWNGEEEPTFEVDANTKPEQVVTQPIVERSEPESNDTPDNPIVSREEPVRDSEDVLLPPFNPDEYEEQFETGETEVNNDISYVHNIGETRDFDIVDRLITIDFNNDVVDKLFYKNPNSGDRKMDYHYLSSYFKYGHYKQNDFDSRYLPGRYKYLADSPESKLIYKIYNDKTYVCGSIKFDNKDVLVPLFETTLKASDNTEVPYDIKITGSISFNRDSDVYTINQDGTIKILDSKTYSKLVIFSSGRNEVSKKEARESKLFSVRNEGKTFAVVSTDPFVTKDDFENYLTTYDEAKDLWTQPDRRFNLVGVKQYVKSSKVLKDLANKKQKNNFKHPFIIYSSTLADIIKTLNTKQKNEIAEKLGNRRSRCFVYTERIDFSIGVYKSKLIPIEEFVNNEYKNQYFYIIRKNKNGDIEWIYSPAEVLQMMSNEHIDTALNTEFFKRGIMINDIKEHVSNPIVEGSNFYGVVDTNNVIDFSTDLTKITEPEFSLVKQKDQESDLIDDVVIEQPLENNRVAPEEIAQDDLKGRIEAKFKMNVVGDIVEYNIPDFSYYGSRNENSKIFFVPLQKGKEILDLAVYVNEDYISEIEPSVQLFDLLNMSDNDGDKFALINLLLFTLSDSNGDYDAIIKDIKDDNLVDLYFDLNRICNE